MASKSGASPDHSVARRRKVPKQARSEATVENILQATLELARAEGFAQLSTPRIAEKAGVSVGSLYQYFSSIEAIYTTLYEKASAECAVDVRSLMMKMVNVPPERGMPIMVAGVLKAYEHHALVLLKLVNDVPSMRARTATPSSSESLLRASIKLYVQIHLPQGKSRELETRLFLMESGVIHAIQRYALERPTQVIRSTLISDLSDTALAYLNKQIQLSPKKAAKRRI
jgi:AcrR family transcriptional regulator